MIYSFSTNLEVLQNLKLKLESITLVHHDN